MRANYNSERKKFNAKLTSRSMTCSHGQRRRPPRPSPVTIRDLAQAVGVSETTVSLAFQEGSRIATATRDRVVSAARKMGYVPNLAARALRLGTPKSIGFLVNDIANPFYAFLVRSADVIARRRGYQVIVSDSHWDPKRETQAVENMIASRVRGVLACLSEKSAPALELLAQGTVPGILVDTVPEGYRGGFVANDLVAAGRLAVEHLLEARCRRLALLAADPPMASFSAFVQLRRGFLDAAGQYGMDPNACR